LGSTLENVIGVDAKVAGQLLEMHDGDFVKAVHAFAEWGEAALPKRARGKQGGAIEKSGNIPGLSWMHDAKGKAGDPVTAQESKPAPVPVPDEKVQDDDKEAVKDSCDGGPEGAAQVQQNEEKHKSADEETGEKEEKEEKDANGEKEAKEEKEGGEGNKEDTKQEDAKDQSNDKCEVKDEENDVEGQCSPETNWKVEEQDADAGEQAEKDEKEQEGEKDENGMEKEEAQNEGREGAGDEEKAHGETRTAEEGDADTVMEPAAQPTTAEEGAGGKADEPKEDDDVKADEPNEDQPESK